MQIKLRTAVPGNLEEVYGLFDQRLFLHLAPPGTKLIVFEGNETGNQVKIKLGFPILSEWHGVIESHSSSHSHYEFVDVGTQTPLGINNWSHKHRIELVDGTVYIDDHITFSCKNLFWSIVSCLLIVPPMQMRRFGYKSYYKHLKK